MDTFKKLSHIMVRIDSRHFAKLWLLYRDYFHDDDLCLNFLYTALKREPENGNAIYVETFSGNGKFVNDKGTVVDDSVFIPRRMLNAVERLVTTAREMDKIRRGKDLFKLVLLVTCVETLQLLKGKNCSKKEQLFDFFENYVSSSDKLFIAKRFFHNDEEHIAKGENSENSFKQFVGVINEYRNCATHEGEYWDIYFNNNDDNMPISVVLNINLNSFSPNSKKEHCFTSYLSYKDFESIFMRACINFINDYVENTTEVVR